MRFPSIRLVEQTEQKFRRFESVLKKKTSDCNSRPLSLIKAPTKKIERGSFALSFFWPDLASVVLVVSVKSGPISLRSIVEREKGSLQKSDIFPSKENAPTQNAGPENKIRQKIRFSAIFSNLRFLFSETQYISDLTSELRI